MLDVPRNLLCQITFKKTGKEIQDRLGVRIAETLAKVEERKKRIASIRKDHGITDADMVELLQQQRENDRAAFYNLANSVVAAPRARKGAQAVSASRAIPAGVVANLAQEAALIRSETSAVSQWQVTHRNIDTKATHEVSHADLEFLGF